MHSILKDVRRKSVFVHFEDRIEKRSVPANKVELTFKKEWKNLDTWDIVTRSLKCQRSLASIVGLCSDSQIRSQSSTGSTLVCLESSTQRSSVCVVFNLGTVGRRSRHADNALASLSLLDEQEDLSSVSPSPSILPWDLFIDDKKTVLNEFPCLTGSGRKAGLKKSKNIINLM